MFCRNCGKKIFDRSAFCEGCGCQLNQFRQPQQANSVINEAFCCPNCRSYDLHATLESTISSSGGGYNGIKGCLGFLLFGPFGLLCGLCGKRLSISTKHTNFWLCKNCGNKFRSTKDIMNECNRIFLRYTILSVIFLIVAIATIGIADSVIAIISGFSVTVSVIGAIVHKIKYEKAKAEYESYSKNNGQR